MAQLDRIEAKLDQLDSRVDRVDTTLAHQAGVLDEHVRRTEAAESALKTLRAEVEPLKAHVQRWAGAGKVLAIGATLAGLFEVFIKALELLK